VSVHDTSLDAHAVAQSLVHSIAAMWVGVRMWSFMACQVRKRPGPQMAAQHRLTRV